MELNYMNGPGKGVIFSKFYMIIKSGMFSMKETSNKLDNFNEIEDRPWLDTIKKVGKFGLGALFVPEFKIGSLYKVINFAEYNLKYVPFVLKNKETEISAPEGTILTFLGNKKIFYRDKIHRDPKEYEREYGPRKIYTEKNLVFLYDGNIYWCVEEYGSYLREVK